jgi:hypothetical protein
MPWAGYSCPQFVNKTNWLNNEDKAAKGFEREFKFGIVPINGDTDLALNVTGNASGWEMDLRLKCCRWEGKEIPTWGDWDGNGEYFDLLAPAQGNLMRLKEPYLSVASHTPNSWSMKDTSALYSGALNSLDGYTGLEDWVQSDWDEFVGNCTSGARWARGPSWTWSFWARVISFGSSSGLVVLARIYPDQRTRENRTSWRIMLYQNGNIGLEGPELDATVREVSRLCMLPAHQLPHRLRSRSRIVRLPRTFP